MAITIDYTTSPRYTIQVPQADLTNISGSLYELDTDQFRLDLKELEAAQQGIVFEDTHRHNSEVTVAGVTYARVIEILNASNSSQTDIYQVLFTPDTTYSVRLAGSNNNIFDLQNIILANAVTQVIPTNSAGLIVSAGGTALTAQETRDAMKLAPTAGTPAAGSIDEHLDDMPTDVVTALKADTFDGETFATIINKLKSFGYGKFIETSEGVVDFYDDAGTTVLFTLTRTEAASLTTRTVS